MFKHQSIWLPDGERHFVEWMTQSGEIVDGKGTYQIRKLRAALNWVKDWRTAVDVGGHVGLWSMQLAKRFRRVEAFEPVAAMRECYRRNVEPAGVTLHACALGAVEGKVRMSFNPADTGGTHVDRTAESGDVDLLTLDSFHLEHVDFIKIDCEGYEHQVLQGARETLLRCKPCVIVEQKERTLRDNFGLKGAPAVDLLRELGAKQRTVMSGDYILSWD